jgi:hypothetical protein
LFDRTTWSERALAVWNSPEAAPLEEHQWFHEYLTATSRDFLAEVGQENPEGLRTSLEHLIDPPNGARRIVDSVTPEAYGQMSDREVTELATSLDRRQQLWLLFELNMALPEAERRAIPISSVDKAAILTDPLNSFVYYPQTSDDGTREEWPTRFPWLYGDGVQVRRYGRWVGMWAAPTPYQREYLLRALRNEYSPELTFYGYTASELLGTDVPGAIPGYITSETDGDLWGLVESPGQIIPEFVVRLIDREGNQSLLPFAYSAEPFTIPHASCWCTPRPMREGPQFIPDIGEGTITFVAHMLVMPDVWHSRTPTISEMQHFVGNSITLPAVVGVHIYTEGQRFEGDAYINGVLYTGQFYITPPETRAE